MSKAWLPAAALAVLAVPALGAADDAMRRLTPAEMGAMAQGGPAGTSGMAAIQTTVVAGDPTKPGLYTIRLTAPAGLRIEAHSHRDARTAVVASGTWYFGYGPRFDEGALKALPPGSFYTEPPGQPHFALTREPVVLFITGYGRTDTRYADPAHDPRNAR